MMDVKPRSQTYIKKMPDELLPWVLLGNTECSHYDSSSILSRRMSVSLARLGVDMDKCRPYDIYDFEARARFVTSWILLMFFKIAH